jgi:hypothetical protein
MIQLDSTLTPAAIDAQGLLRLARYLQGKGDTIRAARYLQAGLTVAKTLFSEPYLSTDPKHQGLILHSIYHQPNGWDYPPVAGKAPYGESSMWGDYHAMELAVCLNGVIVQLNASWNVRVRRDDLLTLQVDGTHGTAVAGLRDVYIQHHGNTPKPIWNPDIKQPIDFFADWSKVPEQESYDNAFKVQWELFLRGSSGFIVARVQPI